jgi:hypothetical protein
MYIHVDKVRRLQLRYCTLLVEVEQNQLGLPNTNTHNDLPVKRGIVHTLSPLGDAGAMAIIHTSLCTQAHSMHTNKYIPGNTSLA